jgi:toxin-antitoxin system PIN domain toxin
VILVDANLLIYAGVRSAPKHAAAKNWLDGRLNGEAPVGIPWSSFIGFLRIVTNHRVFDPPVSSADAWKVVEYWIGCAPVWIPQPGERHGTVLARIFRIVSPKGNLVPDAHLAALAIEHGLVLCSTDGDFARFPELKWNNPLG